MSITRDEKNLLLENYTLINNSVRYLINEIPKHEKYLHECRKYREIMVIVEDIHLRSIQGLAFVNLLKVRSNESEEESFIEETESSEEDNSEDVIYLGSNYENDEKEN